MLVDETRSDYTAPVLCAHISTDQHKWDPGAGLRGEGQLPARASVPGAPPNRHRRPRNMEILTVEITPDGRRHVQYVRIQNARVTIKGQSADACSRKVYKIGEQAGRGARIISSRHVLAAPLPTSVTPLRSRGQNA